MLSTLYGLYGLLDKAFNTAKNQRCLASMVYKLFDKKSTSSNTSGGAAKSEIMSNQKLAEQLHKPNLKNKIFFKKQSIRKLKKNKKYTHLL